MTDTWRPKGWKNPFCESCWWRLKDREEYCQKCNCLYEAGAEAMLEAIWKLAEESPTGTFTFDSCSVNVLHQKGE